jgi:drug/metabolite transporter (DMT)-like permease
MLWAVFTLIAAAAQTARNAMQRELTASLGTVGATHVRFLFGFPFAILFLAGVMLATGYGWPAMPPVFWLWVVFGAATQIIATATMLSVMGERSFVVSYAYIKTEPVQVALFGLIFLGDHISLLTGAAIVIATTGVILISLKPGAAQASTTRSTLIGLFSGSMFAVSAIGYRGAVLSLGHPNFVLAATFTLTVGLLMQAGLLTLYLVLREPQVLRNIMKMWKPSMLAGFMGAFASEFWFLAFAIATAASVRTLALVEVLFAQGITRFIFKQPTTPREGLGTVLVVVGVALLVWAY